jgi:peroxiredoxin
MQSTTDKNEQIRKSCGSVLLMAVVVALGEGCEDRKDKTVEEETQSVARSAEETRPILIGAKVPELMLRTVDGKLFNLNEAIRNRPTVLIFYRGGWCAYCNMQLGQLQGIEAEIMKSGYQIIAISPDRPEKLSESIDKYKMNYLLLSDSNMAGAKAFGIAFKLDESTIKKYDEYGIDLVDASGEEHYSLPVPAVFVVGTDGIIKFEYVNPNYKVRLDPNILLSVVKVEQEEE